MTIEDDRERDLRLDHRLLEKYGTDVASGGVEGDGCKRPKYSDICHCPGIHQIFRSFLEQINVWLDSIGNGIRDYVPACHDPEISIVIGERLRESQLHNSWVIEEALIAARTNLPNPKRLTH